MSLTSTVNRSRHKQSFPWKTYGLDAMARFMEVVYGKESLTEQKRVGLGTHNRTITWLRAAPANKEEYDLHGIMLVQQEENAAREDAQLIYLGRFTDVTARILRSAFHDVNVVASKLLDVDTGQNPVRTVTWEKFIDENAPTEKNAANFDFIP